MSYELRLVGTLAQAVTGSIFLSPIVCRSHATAQQPLCFHKQSAYSCSLPPSSSIRQTKLVPSFSYKKTFLAPS